MTKSQIRLAAVLGAIMIWCAGIVLDLDLGKSLSQAVFHGAAGAVAGLVGWTVYHVASRRNDGLVLVAMDMQPLVYSRTAPPLAAVGTYILMVIPLAWIAGHVTRGIKAKDAAPQANDPMFDADVDDAAKRTPVRQ